MNTIKGAVRRSLFVVGLPLAALVALGQNQFVSPQAVPFNIVTNSGTLPADFVAQHGPVPPPPAFPPHLASTPTPSVTFQGLDDNNTAWPPDTDGCIGPNHVVTMLNTQVRIQDRSGATLATTTLLSWWQTFFPGISVAFDPRILYDPLGQRWIATAATDPQKTTSANHPRRSF